MLWINGNISTLNVMKQLFIPSFVSLIVALAMFGWNQKGIYAHIVSRAHKEEVEPGARTVFFSGIGALMFVPIFKALTGLPPFMGMLISVGTLWLITDLLHAPY